ncbi:MAG TPA: phenylalanine--tRNA ligase beta subunit-related protein [Solirubrobacteraceae bacterium]|jgi:DNA/RNA-binding domain of Phe-tRNA-synthetase-like protein|nr:phenylalanine--tRNA ligase beta subunit-related protein [Solirubrobacteraceae bacterium]
MNQRAKGSAPDKRSVGRLGEIAAGDASPEVGWIASEVQAEFPELRLMALELAARPGPSPQPVRDRLRQLSNRFHGAQAITLRREPIPSAYRIFFRHIGLDPDATRPPAEAAVLDRLLHGGFRSQNLLDDALLLALLDTGIPIWALDAARVEGPLGIRVSRRGERLGRSAQAPRLPAGRLVVADAASAVAVLFGDLAPEHGVSPATTGMRLFCIQVAGVPSIHVEEALWTCSEILSEQPD